MENVSTNRERRLRWIVNASTLLYDLAHADVVPVEAALLGAVPAIPLFEVIR